MKRASDNLVKAAQKAAFDKADDDSVVVKTKFVGGIAQVRQNRVTAYWLQSRHLALENHGRGKVSTIATTTESEPPKL